MSEVTLPGSYISVGDFTQAGTGINPGMLAPGELPRYIFRASRAADGICKQILYATSDTVQLLEDRPSDSYSIDLTDGEIKFFTKRFPIRSISSLKQFFSSADAPAAIPSSRIHIDSSSQWGWVEGIWSAYKRGFPPMYMELVYVNGWLATTLKVIAAASQAQLTLVPQPGQTTVQGIYVGQALEIQDATPEVVTVQSVSGNVVTLTANLISDHVADTFVVETSFNEQSFADAQQAVINLTAHFIKNKGVGPLVLKDERVEHKTRRGPESSLWEEAKELLGPFTVQA